MQARSVGNSIARPTASAAERLDRRVLASVIVAVERSLDDQGIDASPIERASLLVEAYGRATANDGPLDRRVVDRLVWLG